MLLLPVKMIATNPIRTGFACFGESFRKKHIDTLCNHTTVTSVILGTQEPVNIFHTMEKPVFTTTRVVIFILEWRTLNWE